jgi:YD repeat-containing protein
MTWLCVGRVCRPFFLGVAAFALGLGSAHAQTPPSAMITYDGAGRIVTTLYTDQTCIAHKYNAQGNRAETVVTKADTPETSVWGTGAWGCSKWSP